MYKLTYHLEHKGNTILMLIATEKLTVSFIGLISIIFFVILNVLYKCFVIAFIMFNEITLIESKSAVCYLLLT